MAFNSDALGRIISKILSRLSEGGTSIGANIGFVEIEVGIFHQAVEEFILGGLGCGRGSGSDGDARTGRRRTARATGSDGVGRRSRGRDGLLTFGRNGAD